MSHLLREDFQGATSPLAAAEFAAAMRLLDPGATLPNAKAHVGLAEAAEKIEDKYQHSTPEVQERTNGYIERGPVGARLK